MFKCVNCTHEGDTFHVKVTGSDQGALTYQAVCPVCGSRMVDLLPGVEIDDLRITTKKE